MCAARGRLRLATLVDHIHPLVAGGLTLDESNLQSLCAKCHAAKTAEDRAKYPVYS